jgi:hypothetical protein
MYNYLNMVMGGTGGAGSSISTVAGFVTILANIFIIIAVGVSLISIAIAFIQFITSTGDMWGAFGLAVSLLAFTLKNILVASAGITGLK